MSRRLPEATRARSLSPSRRLPSASLTTRILLEMDENWRILPWYRHQNDRFYVLLFVVFLWAAFSLPSLRLWRPGCISEGSRTTLFGSSTSVVVFSPISARRTTAELPEGSAGNAQDAGKSRSVPFIFSLFFSIPSTIFDLLLQLRPLRNSDLGPHSEQSSPLGCMPSFFLVGRVFAFSCLVDSPRIVRTHAIYCRRRFLQSIFAQEETSPSRRALELAK